MHYLLRAARSFYQSLSALSLRLGDLAQRAWWAHCRLLRDNPAYAAAAAAGVAAIVGQDRPLDLLAAILAALLGIYAAVGRVVDGWETT
jgi:hypothetical protein